jgi:hypothetical protein
MTGESCHPVSRIVEKSAKPDVSGGSRLSKPEHFRAKSGTGSREDDKAAGLRKSVVRGNTELR